MLLVSFIFNVRSRISFILHRSSSTIICPREKQGKTRWHFLTRTGNWRLRGAQQPGRDTAVRSRRDTARTDCLGHRETQPPRPSVPPSLRALPSRAATWLAPAVVLALHGRPPAPRDPGAGGGAKPSARRSALRPAAYDRRRRPAAQAQNGASPQKQPPVAHAHARVAPAPFSSRPGPVALAIVRECRQGALQTLGSCGSGGGFGCAVGAGGNWTPISMVANWQWMIIRCFIQPGDPPASGQGRSRPKQSQCDRTGKGTSCWCVLLRPVVIQWLKLRGNWRSLWGK